ncbi:hypothetical protein VTJ49DRAFT_4780 [Mycothermus thermophilus]|uniref:Probable transporter MCH1 n=1 Tax=Humicola insolens TaxID=85995 RepID=A0ABR3VLE8_HUMIN
MARTRNRPPPAGDISDNQPPEQTPLLASHSTPPIQTPPTTTSTPASSIRSSSSTTSNSRRRLISLLAALLSALCAGSVTAFSLYAPTLQSRLRYSQYRVNGLASAASVAMYVPVSLLGYLCDRAGPAPLALLAAAAFGVGYAGAAGAYYRAGLLVEDNGEGERWYVVMVLAFVAIGVGTCAMYMSAVATCAKNFGRGNHRGLAVAMPIAAFGLSGMWLSQVGSRLFGAPGDEIDVMRFFLFLAALLVAVGILGAFSLRIVDEEDLIEEAVEELERSGILDGSAIFTPGRVENGYGTIDQRLESPTDDDDDEGANPINDATTPAAGRKDTADQSSAQLKKRFVLNAETRRFLTDHTMWCFALGFFFMIGPGEAFINNLGTVIKTLYPPTTPDNSLDSPRPTSPATHVSIVGLTSTAARLLTGTLTDLLAPSPPNQHIQLSTPTTPTPTPTRRRFTLSRVTFLLTSALLLSLGLSLLASGLAQDHGDRFWLVSALVGAGYGAVFSLTPIIITVIWGVENFATNWGIVAMFPALGATVWGVVYSAVYTRAVGEQQQQQQHGNILGNEGHSNLCYGRECYAPAFWAMAGSVWIACGLVLWAWKGRGGWAQRGVVV